MEKIKITLMLGLALLYSCSSSERRDFEVKAKTKYPLKEWPDSMYIASIDSILKAEVVKPQPRKTAEVSMPGLLKADDLLSKPVAGKGGEFKQKAVVQSVSPETFLQKFQQALEASLIDPKLTQEISSRQGEALTTLLQRIYGPHAEHIPLFVAKTQIAKLNPGVDLDDLQGEVVVLPQL
ncbi:MAG: hypothetical protein GX801_02645 [Fibrobacter sp.]|nr:hypothetical protein [Fibrobacter sp.]